MGKNNTKTQKKYQFPERLRELRIQRKLSQTDLGKLVGVHYTHIGRYERAESKPSAKALNDLAECLNVSNDFLLNGTVQDAAIANLEDKELLQMFAETEKLPFEDKELVKKFLDAFLMKRRLQKELAS